MRNCIICGQEVKDTTGKRGRPSDKCSQNCRDIHKYFNALEQAVSNAHFTKERARMLKGDLFAIASEINTKSI